MGGLFTTSQALGEDIVNICTDGQSAKDAKDPNIAVIACNGKGFKCTNEIRIDYKDRYLTHGEDTRAKHWKSDHTTILCQDCRCKFGSFTRKHHCRFCGDIFCDSCSKLRLSLKDIYEEADRPINYVDLEDKVERICNQCFRKMLKVDCNICEYSFCLTCGNRWHDKKYCPKK
eukprot:385094_1